MPVRKYSAPEKQRLEREKIRRRRPHRATYDLPVAVRSAMKTLAEEMKIPVSQLAALALIRFLAQVHAGELDIGQYKVLSRSPRYEWNLRLPRLVSRKGGGTDINKVVEEEVN